MSTLLSATNMTSVALVMSGFLLLGFNDDLPIHSTSQDTIRVQHEGQADLTDDNIPEHVIVMAKGNRLDHE